MGFFKTTLGIDDINSDITILKSDVESLKSDSKSNPILSISGESIEVALDDEFNEVASGYRTIINDANGTNNCAISDFVINTPIAWVDSKPTLRYPYMVYDYLASWFENTSIHVLSADFSEIEAVMLEQGKFIKFKENPDVALAPDDPYTIGFIGVIKNFDGSEVTSNPFGEETYKIRLRIAANKINESQE